MKRLYIILLTIGATLLPSEGFCSEILLAVKGSATMTDQDDTLNLRSLIKITPFTINIIPPSAGVQFYKDGLVFLANSRSEGRMLESHTSFGSVEAYYAPLNENELGNSDIFSSSGSWSVPCEAMTFNRDYSIMYFTKNPSKKESEKIFEAKHEISKNGKSSWVSENKPLSFCSDKSVYTHPALSADGEKMVFASDTKGSVGGFDLFISYKEDDDWSTPINLGNLINTQGNEAYPFLDRENNLFFSSDGIEGFGGYDIFYCRYNGRGWDKPVNLTQIINTPEDDLAFTLSQPDGRSAFFSKREKSGNRVAQLYMITFQRQYAVSDLTNLSDTFKYLARARMLAYDTEVIVTEPKPETKKPDAEAVKKPVIETPPVQERIEIAEEKPEPAIEEPAISANDIIYRVQFLSSATSKGSYEIEMAGETYQTYEYLYAGAYRQCAGEFNSPAPALDLQNAFRRNGYSDAFLVAFKNDQRLTGSMLALARSQQQAEQNAANENIPTQIPNETANVPEQPAAETKPATDDNAPVFRVQFLSSSEPKGSSRIDIGGVTYQTYEYLYAGAYRSCAGEFRSRDDANNLREALRREGYSDAFVVAFINNERVTDPSLLQ